MTTLKTIDTRTAKGISALASFYLCESTPIEREASRAIADLGTVLAIACRNKNVGGDVFDVLGRCGWSYRAHALTDVMLNWNSDIEGRQLRLALGTCIRLARQCAAEEMDREHARAVAYAEASRLDDHEPRNLGAGNY